MTYEALTVDGTNCTSRRTLMLMSGTDEGCGKVADNVTVPSNLDTVLVKNSEDVDSCLFTSSTTLSNSTIVVSICVVEIEIGKIFLESALSNSDLNITIITNACHIFVLSGKNALLISVIDTKRAVQKE